MHTAGEDFCWVLSLAISATLLHPRELFQAAQLREEWLAARALHPSPYFSASCVFSQHQVLIQCVFHTDAFSSSCSYTLIFLPMAFVCVCSAYHVARNASSFHALPLTMPHRSPIILSPLLGSTSELHAPQSRSLLIGIISVVFFLLCMSCTTFLTWQFAVYATNGYLVPGTGWPLNLNYTNNYFQGNYDPLNFALFKWNPTGPIIVQLWPDVVIFTAFMLVLFLFGFAARLSPAISAALNRQIKVPKLGSFGFGTLLLSFWTSAFFGIWLYYWSVLYCDNDCMSDKSKSSFQCCRMFQETRKCTVVMQDPTYGCGTKEQQANAGISPFFACCSNFVVTLSCPIHSVLRRYFL